jgi:dimethylargininase
VKRILVREPSSQLDDGIVTYVAREPVDLALAQRQWTTYVETVTNAGWQAVVVPLDAPCPDSVFIEDPVFVYRDIAILTRPSMLRRRFEVLGLETSLGALGYSIHKIEAPGTLEGGDLLPVGNDIYVGFGGRSNAEGIGQLRAILGPTGANIIPVPMGPAVHLKSAVTSLPDGSFIGYPPALADTGIFPKLYEVPELQASNVVLLGDNKVLIAANCVRSASLIERLGFDLVPVDISEFQKREGDVSCLSVRLPELTIAPLPGSAFDEVNALTV